MKRELFFTSLIFAIVGWGMFVLDKIVNNSSTDVTTIGVIAGVLGLFGISISLTE